MGDDRLGVCLECNVHAAREDTRPLSSTMACGHHQVDLEVGPIVQTASQVQALVVSGMTTAKSS